MSKVIILKVGYDTFAIPDAKGRAGQLLEIFQGARPVRNEYRRERDGGDHYRLEHKNPPTVSIEMIDPSRVLAPKPDSDASEAIDLPALPGGVKLLMGGGK